MNNKVKLSRSEEIAKWRKQGVDMNFKGQGYGKFANGIPCSVQFRNTINTKKIGGVR